MLRISDGLPSAEPTRPKVSALFLIILVVVGVLIGVAAASAYSYTQTSGLQNQINNLESQVSGLRGFQNATYQNIYITDNGTSLSDIYQNIHNSVVLIEGSADGGTQEGSGFVYNFEGQNVILTNFHVVNGASDISVTFPDGHGYAATVLGSDLYSDLAVVQVTGAPASEFKPLTIVSSSSLSVGETVIAIGNPYGLADTLTTGVVSALGRTITEDAAGNYSIANIIQTSTPINPGNSGGPLLNAVGNVIGITTAIVTNSQGLGFAIPSDTILREVSALVTTGKYTGHSYVGVAGEDMSYSLAQQYGTSVTYGWRIGEVVPGGPSDGKLQVGDIIIAIDNQTIRGNDDFASYLDAHTLPGDTVTITAMRGNSQVNVPITLGTRPPPSS